MMSNMARRALTVAAALALAATAAAAANAIAVDPGEQRQGSLASFGPLMDNGFPTSYKDSHALRLEACAITAADPLCASAAGDTYDPDQPLSFPNNFPDEFFHQLASAKVPVPGNGELLVETTSKARSSGNGSPAKDQQVVFGRVRIRAKDVPDGTTCGSPTPTASMCSPPLRRQVRHVETADIGVTPGNFSGALASRIGPFLKWDPAVAPAAPAGHIGRPRRVARGHRQSLRHQLHQGRAAEPDGTRGPPSDSGTTSSRCRAAWRSTAASKWTRPLHR